MAFGVLFYLTPSIVGVSCETDYRVSGGLAYLLQNCFP